MTRAWPTLTLALCAALAGCVATPGDFCHRDEDCAAPLRCSGAAEVRGVCVYPEAIPDTLVLPDAFVRPPLPLDGRADAADAGQDAADATPDAMDAAPPADLGADAAPDMAPDAPGPGPEPDLGAADALTADG